MFPTRSYLLGLILLSVFPVCSQTANPDPTQGTTFRATVRRVLVDVVVTNSKDEPVTALPRDQFQVFEDGHPQTLTSFEEHAGLPDMTALQAKLPPNTFSNLPLAKAGDAANILLLDALNTQIQDQSYVHVQMIKYIQGIRPGTRLAIFTLGERLRFVQGFTGDPALLMAAVNGQKSAGNPQLSPLLQTSAEADAENRLAAQMQELAASTGSAQIQASAAALQQFQAETLSFHTDVRVHTTLEAMQQLARYLQGIPGRKNVIWFSGSFPLSILSDFSLGGADPMRQYQDEVARTANLLTAAQIAIYPIGAQGVAVDRLYDFSGPQPPKSAYAQQMTQYQVSSLQAGSTDRAAAFAAMDELAKDTGGEALYGTNGQQCLGPRAKPRDALLHDHVCPGQQEHGRKAAPHRGEGQWRKLSPGLSPGLLRQGRDSCAAGQIEPYRRSAAAVDGSWYAGFDGNCLYHARAARKPTAGTGRSSRGRQ